MPIFPFDVEVFAHVLGVRREGIGLFEIAFEST